MTMEYAVDQAKAFKAQIIAFNVVNQRDINAIGTIQGTVYVIKWVFTCGRLSILPLDLQSYQLSHYLQGISR
jgi:hypothetical protein